MFPKLAFDLAGLMFNSYCVVGMRTAQLVMGTAAASEISRMYAEKGAALLEAQAAAGMALATGRSAHVVAGRALSPVRETRTSEPPPSCEAPKTLTPAKQRAARALLSVTLVANS